MIGRSDDKHKGRRKGKTEGGREERQKIWERMGELETVSAGNIFQVHGNQGVD